MSTDTSKRWKWGDPMDGTSKRWKWGDPVGGRRPLLGPDNRPIYGPDNKPIFGPDNKPIFGPENNKPGIMEGVKVQLQRYKEPLMTGALAVVFGLGARKFMKMDNISTGSVKQAGISFALVALAAVASQELEDMKYV